MSLTEFVLDDPVTFETAMDIYGTVIENSSHRTDLFAENPQIGVTMNGKQDNIEAMQKERIWKNIPFLSHYRVAPLDNIKDYVTEQVIMREYDKHSRVVTEIGIGQTRSGAVAYIISHKNTNQVIADFYEAIEDSVSVVSTREL